jgi:hypothetical protein
MVGAGPRRRLSVFAAVLTAVQTDRREKFRRERRFPVGRVVL